MIGSILVDSWFAQRVEYIYSSQIQLTIPTFLIYTCGFFSVSLACFSASMYLRMCIKREANQKLRDANFN